VFFIYRKIIIFFINIIRYHMRSRSNRSSRSSRLSRSIRSSISTNVSRSNRTNNTSRTSRSSRTSRLSNINQRGGNTHTQTGGKTVTLKTAVELLRKYYQNKYAGGTRS
jgi:hypothetical protein